MQCIIQCAVLHDRLRCSFADTIQSLKQNPIQDGQSQFVLIRNTDKKDHILNSQTTLLSNPSVFNQS